MVKYKEPTIPEFYRDRTIFITGANGFMGKVLVEKLLRSCPDIKEIYILLREKRGKSVETRFLEMLNIPLFDRLRKEHPGICERKLRILPGNVKELNLGLSEDSRKLVEENVSIVFHAAASVRFDDPLKDAILLNTRGTREVMKLAQNMKQLKVLLHVSTTYCNTDKKFVEEKIYPPHADWQKTIELAERYDSELLRTITPSYIYPLTNTYTFAKSLAEHVVADMSKDIIPSIIFRPSIVISTLSEPIPGWIDNFNGPVGLLAACGKGILRTMCSDPDLVADFIPADTAVKSMVTAVWYKGIQTNGDNQLTVYNSSSNGVKKATFGEIIEMGKEFAAQYPLDSMLWVPGGSITKNKISNFIKFVALHILPAIIVDIILKISGQSFSLLKIQRKIYTANMALYYFISNEWKFSNDNFLNLTKKILDNDIKDWDYDFSNENVREYFLRCVRGGKQYLMKEDLRNLPSARKNYLRMYWLDKILKLIFIILAIYIFFYTYIYDYLTSFVFSILDFLKQYLLGYSQTQCIRYY